MDATERAQLLDALGKIMEEQPSMRFGQLICYLAIFACGPFKSAVYDVEDKDLLEAANRHLRNLEKRREAMMEVNRLREDLKQKKSAA